MMYKRFALVGLTALTTSVFASAPATTSTTTTTVTAPTGISLVAPDSHSAWALGLEAFYVQPTNSYQYAANAVLLNGVQDNESVDQDPSWGGEIDATYHFAGSSRDVTLDYTHLEMDNSSTTSGRAFSTSFNVPILADGVKGETEQDYNSADLLFGQQFLIADRLIIHPFGGLRFADIDIQDSTEAMGATRARSAVSGDTKSDYQGLGPRAGVDLRVLTNTGFSFVGTVGGSLLVGDSDASIDIDSLAALDNLNLSTDSTRTVVPELDARLGLDYTPHFVNPAAAINFQLGYQVVEYFNVVQIDNIDMLSVNSNNSSSNFGYQGPYARIQVSF